MAAVHPIRQEVDEPLLREVAGRLSSAVVTGSKVFVFGSHARGQAGPDSDLDLLVVTPEQVPWLQESARLRVLLLGIGHPVDLLVTSRAEFEKRKALPQHLYHEVERDGRRIL